MNTSWRILFALVTTLTLMACSNSKTAKSPSTKAQPSTEITTATADANTNDLGGRGLSFEGGNGFFSLQSKGVPESVRLAGRSVFHLEILGGREELIQTVDVSEDKGRELKQRISTKYRNKDFTEALVLIKQIEFCERAPRKENQKSCTLNFDIRKSSGFIAGDANTLWAASHAVNAYLDLVLLGAKISKQKQLRNHQRVAVFIFDAENRLVFDPYVDKATILAPPRLTKHAIATKRFFGDDSDYISLNLSKRIAPPLSFAREVPAVGNSVYVLGFPACTACALDGIVVDDPLDFADRSPAPNSDGKGLKFTFGKILPLEGLEAFFDIEPGTLQRMDLKHMIFHSADSHYGMSGGPTLNARGEVIAIHGGGKSRVSHKVHQRISRGSRP